LNRKTALSAVIFDMDGVIIDSHPAHRKAWKDFLLSVGHQVPERELDYILEGRKRRDILRHFLGDLPEDELSEYGKRKDQFFERAAAEVRTEVQAMPGVVDFLRQIVSAQIAAAVATSASKVRTHCTLERLTLHRYFSVVVTGDDVAIGKPDPAIYRTACRKLRVRAGNVLVIEDAVSGVQAATRAGMCCIGLVGDRTPPDTLRAAGAKCVIGSFHELTLEGATQLLQPAS
jgi:HAD superfamily hydrolase (TIGR01509 family)